MIFEAASKFDIVSVKLILPKVGVDGCTWPQRENDNRLEKICKSDQRCKGENIDYWSHFSVIFQNNKWISNCFCKSEFWYLEKGGWRIYRATTVNWHQILIWSESNLKKFRVQIEISAAVFSWISKQQLNLLLFLSDWYCGKLGLTDLRRHNEKVTSDKKMIFISLIKVQGWE